MPQNYSPSGSDVSYPLPLPKDGELWGYGSVMQGVIQPMIDGIGFLKARVDAVVGTAGITRVSDIPGAGVTASDWTLNEGFDLALTYQNGTLGRACVWPLSVPHGSTLTAVTVPTLPASGHTTATPVGMPSAQVKKIAIATGVATNVGGSVSDPTTSSIGAYEAYHTWSITGLAEVIDRSLYRYVVVVTSESGTHALTGSTIYAPSFTFTGH